MKLHEKYLKQGYNTDRSFELASERIGKNQSINTLNHKILDNFAKANNSISFTKMAEEKAVLAKKCNL